MINTEVFKAIHSVYGCHSDPALSLFSNSDSVFSIGEGKVCAVFDIGGDVAIVTQDNFGKFYCYFNLNKSFVEKDNSYKEDR